MGRNADYIRQETVTGVVPMMKKDRQYSFIDLFLATSGFSIATWCYTQGATVAPNLSFWQLLINIFCFNIVWIIIECVPVLFATRYGIDLWIWLRSVLGSKGVSIIATVISLANFGWYAVAANLFADSMVRLFAVFGVTLPAIATPILGILCVVLGTLIALGGPDVIKWTNRFLVTALLIVGGVVVVLCFTSVPLTEIINYRPQVDDGEMSALARFMISGEANVAFAFSWSTQALVMPRLAKTERSGFWGTAVPYGVVAPFFVAAGGIMAIATFIKVGGEFSSDPTQMLSTLCGPAFALLSLLMVAFANVGTQGTGSYVNCMIVKSGMPKVSYKLLVLIAMVYVSVLTASGWCTTNFQAFISIAAFIQGPVIGMTFVDYLLVKKRKISLRSAYNLKGHDAYKFTGGFNLVGIGCLVISLVVAMLFVYNPATGDIRSGIFYITTGSGFTAIFGGLLYFVASLTPLKKYMLRDRDDIDIV